MPLKFPSPAVIHASPPALSLASLSLSSSPPSNVQQVSTSLTGASRTLAPDPHAAVPLNDGSNVLRASTTPDASNAKPIPIGTGKKRGVEHKCESCSKIYRHPSCLIKHRWEHTPHWREASKFVLSKHQQVQLLEAAAILSHLSPQSSSLPEDRSLWPSFLSGGSLPPPDPSTLMSTSDSKRSTSASVSASATATVPAVTMNGTLAAAVSSSVPATTGYNRASSTDPRMHDYSIPVGDTTAAGTGAVVGVTQLRPGLLGVPTTSDGFANGTNGQTHVPTNGHPMSVPITASQSWSSVSISESGGTGWSLPRSSIRSISGSSRSRSGSASDDENDADNDHDNENESIDGDEGSSSSSLGRRYGRRGSYGYNGYSHHRTQQPRMWKREEDDPAFGSVAGWSLREEDEYERADRKGVAGVVATGGGKAAVNGVNGMKNEKEWDGMEMEMDMD